MRKKQFLLLIATLFLASVLYAQKDDTFDKHEVKVSVGDPFLAQVLWTYNPWGDKRNNADLYVNVSLSYFYRPVKWFWVGGNFINYFGSNISYTWREYDVDGNYKDFSKSKMKYCAVIAPEVRFSYLNRDAVILYSALSGGICFENGFTTRRYKYPEINYFFQLTLIGVNAYVGKTKNFFLGGEFGFGLKGFGNIHAGYRF